MRWADALAIAIAIVSTSAGAKAEVQLDVGQDVRATGIALRSIDGSTNVRCVAPCTLRVKPGEYAFSVLGDDGAGVDAGYAKVTSAAFVQPELRSHWDTRAAGWFLLGTGALAGAGVYYLGAHANNCSDGNQCPHDDPTIEGIGIVIGVVSAVVALPFILRKDEAIVTLLPLNAAEANVRDARSLAGFTLTAVF